MGPGGARSHSGSRSSTSSVLSMSSFGDSSHESAHYPESPGAEAPNIETTSEPHALASPREPYSRSSRFFLTDEAVRFLVCLFQRSQHEMLMLKRRRRTRLSSKFIAVCSSATLHGSARSLASACLSTRFCRDGTKRKRCLEHPKACTYSCIAMERFLVLDPA